MKTLISFAILALLFSCKGNKARKPVSHQSGSFITESVKRNQKIVNQEEKRIAEIISKDSTNTYLSDSNGFWYYYNKQEQNDTITPQFGDLVKFEYNIETLEGNPIYTTEEIGMREYTIDQEDVFSGLRQGLKLLKAGETATFLFPSHKAFGYYGDQDKIGSNIPIRSTITVKTIKKNEQEQKQD